MNRITISLFIALLLSGSFVQSQSTQSTTNQYGLTAKDLGLTVPAEYQPRGLPLYIEDATAPTPASYLDALLLKYKEEELDLGEAVKIDSPELVLQYGLLDSLLYVTQQMGNSRKISSKWLGKNFAEAFYNYYRFQKSIYGPLQEITIQEVYRSSPLREKKHYPKYFQILCEAKTQQAQGRAMFQYYQLGSDSFRFHKYQFEPYDYEKVGRIDSLTENFFENMQQKQYDKVIDGVSVSFKKRIKDRKKFLGFLEGLKITEHRQLTSRLDYDESGLGINAYYFLPEENKYLLVKLKKMDSGFVMDDLSLISKQ
ncbi:MAG: hypothetical protein V4615_10825 [Bacteroidota bacterium]